MLLNDIARSSLSLLSSWYPNEKISEKKNIYLLKKITRKIKKIKINHHDLQKTHIKFNLKILKLLKDRNLKNFLRINFIQKMFFLHNRYFVYRELKEIQKSQKWKFYQKILKEDGVGNPVRYFLYLRSSGNRINHVYHLYLLEKNLKINLKKDIKKVFEFGGGYGCMARIFSKINRNIEYTCFDTSCLNLLQYYYLSHNNLNVGFSKNNKIFLSSRIKKKGENFDLFIANWSISETPIHFRKKIMGKLIKSKYILISFQEKFENINNLKYFRDISNKLDKSFKIKIIRNKFYNGNIFNNQNHYFFFARRI